MRQNSKTQTRRRTPDSERSAGGTAVVRTPFKAIHQSAFACVLAPRETANNNNHITPKKERYTARTANTLTTTTTTPSDDACLGINLLLFNSRLLNL